MHHVTTAPGMAADATAPTDVAALVAEHGALRGRLFAPYGVIWLEPHARAQGKLVAAAVRLTHHAQMVGE